MKMASIKHALQAALILTFFQISASFQTEQDLIPILEKWKKEILSIVKVDMDQKDLKIAQHEKEIIKLKHISSVLKFKSDQQSETLTNLTEIVGKQQKIMEEIIEFKELTKVFTITESCSELASQGIDKSQKYLLDFDQKGIGEAPVVATCDFLQDATIIGENTTFTAENCAGIGCYEEDIDYANISMAQINALVERSENCYQDIEIECNFAPLKVNLAFSCGKVLNFYDS